jgi:hypothetical protein
VADEVAEVGTFGEWTMKLVKSQATTPTIKTVQTVTEMTAALGLRCATSVWPVGCRPPRPARRLALATAPQDDRHHEGDGTIDQRNAPVRAGCVTSQLALPRRQRNGADDASNP